MVCCSARRICGCNALLRSESKLGKGFQCCDWLDSNADVYAGFPRLYHAARAMTPLRSLLWCRHPACSHRLPCMGLLLHSERCGSGSHSHKYIEKAKFVSCSGGQESLEIDHRDLVRVRNPPLFTHAKCPGPHEQPANDYDNYPQSTRRRRDLDQRMPYPEMSDLPVNIRCGNSHA